MLQKCIIKKWFWALVLLASVCGQLSAGPVAAGDAEKIALNFYQANFPFRGQLSAVLKYTQIESNNTTTFYVFDINPVHGFVIVSADNRVSPVIAYSTETNFNVNFKSTGLLNWVNDKSAEILYTIQNNLQADSRTAYLWSAYEQGTTPSSSKDAGVPPLCATIWNQENTDTNPPPPPYLYNMLCPYNSADKQRSLTGCVATAIAQIMKYWNYPAQGTGSYSYTDNPVNGFSNNYGTLSANFGATAYQWANMPNSLNTSCSTGSDSAISMLMYQCGIAIATDYGDDNQAGSGAYMLQIDAGWQQPCAQSAFAKYFSYDSNTIEGFEKYNYNSSDWINLIENELNDSRPVLYQGTDQNSGGSHAWVCDGYDQNDNLHMNWGWGGSNNGFFAVNSLNPLSYDFSQDNEVLIGIQPALSIPVSAVAENSTICSGNSTTLTATGPAGATYSWFPTYGLSNPNSAATNAYPYNTTTYTVTVDSFGYTGTASVTVNVDAYLDIDFGDVNDVSCHGLSDGSIELVVSGGTGHYSYLWNNGETTDSIANLSEGEYRVTVTDVIQCSGTTSKYITQPNVLQADLTPTNGSCYSSGSKISSYVSGGTQSYSYSWSTGANTPYISQLASGTYTLTITDSHDCVATASASVNSSASVIVTAVSTGVSCFGGDNGSILLDVTGGTGPYNYSWNNNSQSDTLNNLAAGTYSVTVYDNNHCSSSNNFSIVQPQKIVITTSSGNASGGQNNGSASVSSISGGNPPYSYSWSNGQTGQTISNLAQGGYTVTVTDSKGCEQTASASVNVATGIANVSNIFFFNIYPNPAKGDVIVQLNKLDNETILSFKNVLGQELFTKTITGLTTTIDISPFANGVYFAELQQGELLEVREVVINR